MTLLKGTKGMILSRALKEEKEFQECTFKPKINSLDPKKTNLYGIGMKVPANKVEKKKKKSANEK